MTTAAIRDTIRLARLHEQEYGHLAKILGAQVRRQIHFAIQLPEANAVDSLVEFVVAYIEQVPNFIDAARKIARNAGIEDYAETFLGVAEDFFLKPPEEVTGHIGLHELMDEAYLAHRLLEEINDRFMMRAGMPLIPMDTAMSNLIVHALIGEPFANELDEAVQHTVERTMLKESVYESPAFKAFIEAHKDTRWQGELQNWPSLTDKLPVNLQFASL